MKKITDYLEQLGLSKIEAQLYQGLLEMGKTTIMELANHIGMKRITAHFNIESLIKKGLVIQTMEGARRYIIAEPPERFGYLVEQKLEYVKHLQEKLPDIIQTIGSNFPKANVSEDIEIKYYKGKDSVKVIYDEVLRAKEIRAYVNALEVAKIFPENMKIFIETHNKRKNMKIWEIMNKSPKAQDYAEQMAEGRYFYKFIPEYLDLSVVDYMIYDGKVAIVNIKERATGLIISNQDYYDNAKAIFDFVWKMLPDV
jgi:sugar-specific transcriptional regulator TrmB